VKELTTDDAFGDEFRDFSFRDNGVVHIQSAVFPLDGAVNIESVAQPVVGGTPANIVQSTIRTFVDRNWEEMRSKTVPHSPHKSSMFSDKKH